MQRTNDENRHAALLRQRAEEVLRGKPVELGDLHPEDIQYLLQELQVHQMELSLQNEELRRVRRELEVSRDLYFDLYNFAPAGYCTLSRKDRILEANRTLAAILEVEPQALINQKLSKFVDRADQDEYYLYRRRAFAAQTRQVCEIRMLKPGGEKIYARLESAIAHGDDAHIRVMLSDITEKKQAEAVLRATEETNRQLWDFAFTASHDLKEPLRKIKSFGDMLVEKYAGQMDAEGQSYLARILRAAVRMDKMLEGVLNYARTADHQDDLKLVSLGQVVSDVIDDLDLTLEQTGGRVQVDDLPAIQADPLQMHQLFKNLLSNALKFSRPGVPPLVKVHARFDPLEAHPPEISKELHVKIYVEDNGIGFDMDELGHLFEPFHRLVGRHQYEGVGLGLAICHRIVERHGGSITAQSEPQEGTTFIITLPIQQKSNR